MSSEGQTQYWDPQSSSTAYEQPTSQPPPPPGYQGTSQPPPPPPPPPGYENVQNRPQQSASEVKLAKGKGMIQKWMSMLPCMHMCWAWTCAIINWTIPGLGAIMAAFIVLCPCCSKHPTCADRLRICCINFWFGLIQFITMPLIIGSIFAAYWGWFFVIMSYVGYHSGADVKEIREVVVSPPSTSNTVAPGGSKTDVY
ncbi:uncharacterized protein LOC144448919 [Glandiceps talaboti]